MGIKAKFLTHTAALAYLGLATAGVDMAWAGDDETQATMPEPVQVAQYGIQVPYKDTTVRRGETVFQRSRPELRPMGVRVGTFVLLPRVDINQEYNDNIFATDTNEEEDFITHVMPGASLVSDWNNHEVRLDADGDIGRYWDNDDENYEDYSVRASGRLDVRRSTQLYARAGYQALHEGRDSPDDVSGTDLTDITVTSANIEGRHQLNRVHLSVGAGVNSFDYSDVTTSTGVTINNDDRDYDEFDGFVRIGYELVPEYEAFVRGSVNDRNYDSAVDDNGINRDSDGYEAVAGISIDFGGLTFGDFFAGYRSQSYDAAILRDVSGPTVGADITWNATPLTTLIGTVSREIRETLVADANGNIASGRFFTTFGISAQHELLRNLLLGLDASYSEDDFEGISRTDEIYRIGLNATYMINRTVHLSGGYNYLVRDSDLATADFASNSLFVQVRLQY